MQSIWMSIVLEAILQRKMPSQIKIIGAIICLLGTIFATELFNNQLDLNWKGMLLGFAAGMSYTLSIYSSSTIEKQYPNYLRSMYLVLGGLILITGFWNVQIIEHLSVHAIYWGAILALFGTILPPLLFTAGIPKTGIGMGSIISSIEIPVSVLSAYLILQEKISYTQWLGVIIIISSVILVNIKSSKQ